MTTRPLIALLLAACICLAGCGSDESGDEAADTRRPDTSAERSPEPGSPEAVEEKSSIGAFAETPEITACMEGAGFASDAPPTGALRAWRHADGAARAAIASDPGVSGGIEAELAGAGQPTQTVDGTVVLAGPEDVRSAAEDCLT